MGTFAHEAEITDPVTGETTTVRAASAAELDQAIEEHLAARFPASEE